MPDTLPEPWLRGPMPAVYPLIQPVLFSFAQVREDLAKHVMGLTADQVWRKHFGASLGFHLKHLAGSVDRLTTYLAGHPLSDVQLRALREESSGEEDSATLVRVVDDALYESEQRLRALDPQQIYETRTVGRKQLPTTVIGLLVHLAEHTQRHLGQAITLAKLSRDQT